LIDIDGSFIKLGFHPSKIIRTRVFYLSRQGEILKYAREVGFKNPKHLSKLPEFGIAL
jgi:hypothetical protein